MNEFEVVAHKSWKFRRERDVSPEPFRFIAVPNEALKARTVASSNL